MFSKLGTVSNLSSAEAFLRLFGWTGRASLSATLSLLPEAEHTKQHCQASRGQGCSPQEDSCTSLALGTHGLARTEVSPSGPEDCHSRLDPSFSCLNRFPPGHLGGSVSIFQSFLCSAAALHMTGKECPPRLWGCPSPLTVCATAFSTKPCPSPGKAYTVDSLIPTSLRTQPPSQGSQNQPTEPQSEQLHQ